PRIPLTYFLVVLLLLVVYPITNHELVALMWCVVFHFFLHSRIHQVLYNSHTCLCSFKMVSLGHRLALPVLAYRCFAVETALVSDSTEHYFVVLAVDRLLNLKTEYYLLLLL